MKSSLSHTAFKSTADTEQIKLVRQHLRDIRAQFLKGDFSGPTHIHGAEMSALGGLEAAQPGQSAIATGMWTLAPSCATGRQTRHWCWRFTAGSTRSSQTTALMRWPATTITATPR